MANKKTIKKIEFDTFYELCINHLTTKWHQELREMSASYSKTLLYNKGIKISAAELEKSVFNKISQEG